MSEFAKQNFINSTPKPTRPISVVNPGVDTTVFNPLAPANTMINFEMDKVREEEAFLFVGQLTHNNIFLDRKNIGLLVKLFCQTFKGMTNKPALILKTGGTNISPIDRTNLLEYIKAVKMMVPNNDCSAYLLHGELNDIEMSALMTHKKIIAHISLTRGEGYGLPLLEASMSGKPVIAPNYSGHLDFLADKFIKLPGQLNEIPTGAISEYYPSRSQWFDVNEEAVCETLKQFHLDKQSYLKNAEDLAKINIKKFSYDTTIKNMHKYYDAILNERH
jgi:glycosyltransferase involved in cell wall biosynthesis